jgi:hypothetical protein
MRLTADLFELIYTNLPRVLVIAMVAIFLLACFVELIKKRFACDATLNKKRFRRTQCGRERKHPLQMLGCLTSFSGFVSI